MCIVHQAMGSITFLVCSVQNAVFSVQLVVCNTCSVQYVRSTVQYAKSSSLQCSICFIENMQDRPAAWE